MAAVLDVWIARPGDACLVDDDEWIVEVDDSHGNVFQWAGTTYANLPAPHAHWAGTIPPGCYVVYAVNAKTGIHTDHAIVAAECTGVICVRLFVAGSPASCKITIKEVEGIGQPVASAVQVTGTASNCDNVQVTLSCATGLAHTTTVPVSANGSWTAIISAENLRCLCGKPVTVKAQCIEHQECQDQFQSDMLKCVQG